MITNSITLTPEQTEAVAQIDHWLGFGDRVQYRLGGYAGTGKTTLIKHFLEDSKLNTAVCAFTGKAANVLQRKKVPAQTIHSLIYNVKQEGREITFELKSKNELRHIDLIIVDEASMLSTELYKDLRTFEVPILFVGDPGQLEPVGDNPNLMLKPDYVLKTIHRQALESNIIGLSLHVREGGQINEPRFATKGDVEFVSKKLSGHLLAGVDQIICAKNATKDIINKAVRSNFGYTDKLVVGEKLMCLQNNRSMAVFNGQMFNVTKIHIEYPSVYVVDLENDLGQKWTKVELWSDPFHRPMDAKERPPGRDIIYANYGYCITCHKSQGSEWDHVLVVDEYMPPKIWDMKRWRYTAITRAAKKLSYAI
jgi:exodeoxyribonuclease-5